MLHGEGQIAACTTGLSTEKGRKKLADDAGQHANGTDRPQPRSEGTEEKGKSGNRGKYGSGKSEQSERLLGIENPTSDG